MVDGTTLYQESEVKALLTETAERNSRLVLGYTHTACEERQGMQHHVSTDQCNEYVLKVYCHRISIIIDALPDV